MVDDVRRRRLAGRVILWVGGVGPASGLSQVYLHVLVMSAEPQFHYDRLFKRLSRLWPSYEAANMDERGSAI